MSKLREVKSEGLLDEELCVCAFCRKESVLPPCAISVCRQLSPRGEYYCRSCLRNGFANRNHRHVLMLSFRSVFGYYYYNFYKGKKKAMGLVQIQDFVHAHELAGQSNPVFYYDPESYLWFVNFEHVGQARRQIPVDEVKKTILNILVCFNLPENLPNLRLHKFYDKFREAIDNWHAHRARPENRPICLPTFKGCGLTETKDEEKTRDFLPHMLVL